MAYSKRSDYLKSLNQMRNNYQNYGNVFVNPSDDTTNVGNEISSYAYMNTSIPAPESARNGWQRAMDTLEEGAANVGRGFLNFIDGIADFLIAASGEIGSWFGADDQWAKDAITYDWVNQANEALLVANPSDFFSGDAFTEDYWKNLNQIGTKQGAQQRMLERREDSFTSDNEEVSNIYTTVTEGIGNVLPSIILGIVSGGSSLAATAVSVGASSVSAAGNMTSQAVQEGAELDQALTSGLISGGIEAGTELASMGLGKVVSKSGNKFLTKIFGNNYGSRINGATFGKTLASKSFKEIGRSALEEGTEEFVSELLSPFAKIPYKGTEAFEEYKSEELYKNAGYSFLGGAAGGLFGNVVQGTYVNRKYGKQGAQIFNELNEISELHQQTRREIQKGTSANQELISANEEKIGQMTKNLVDSFNALKENNPTQYENLIKFLENGRQVSDYDQAKNEIIQTYGQDAYTSLLNEMSNEKVRYVFGDDFTNDTRAFYNTTENGQDVVVINPTYKNQIYKILGHETIVHNLLDSSSKAFNELESFINKNKDLKALYDLNDSKIAEEYGTEDAKQFRSEKMANFIEQFIDSEKDLKAFLPFKDKGLKGFLNSLKNLLSSTRNRTLINKINKILTNLDKNDTKFYENKIKLAKNKTNDNIKTGEKNDTRRIEEGTQENTERLSIRSFSIEGYGKESRKLSKILKNEISDSRNSSRQLLSITSNISKKKYIANLDGQSFHNVFKNIHNNLDLADQVIVDLHDLSFYKQKGGKTFIGTDGLSVGFIEKNGNIVSALNVSSQRGFSNDFLTWAVDNGGRYMDCMSTLKTNKMNLPELYSKNGFMPVAKIKYDRNIMLENHTLEEVNAFEKKYGESDIIFSAYYGSNVPLFDSRESVLEHIDNLPYVTWDEAVKIRDNYLEKVKYRDKFVRLNNSTSEEIKKINKQYLNKLSLEDKEKISRIKQNKYFKNIEEWKWLSVLNSKDLSLIEKQTTTNLTTEELASLTPVKFAEDYQENVQAEVAEFHKNLVEKVKKEFSNTIIKEANQRNINKVNNKNKVVTIVTGLPGAGKSSGKVKSLLKNGAIELDNDIAKTVPSLRIEYDNGLGANTVQDIVSVAQEDVLNTLANEGYDIVFPVIGKKYHKVLNQINFFTDKGYTVDVIHVKVDNLTSQNRAIKRFFETGRYVSYKYITSIEDNTSLVYNEIKEGKNNGRIDIRTISEINNESEVRQSNRNSEEIELYSSDNSSNKVSQGENSIREGQIQGGRYRGLPEETNEIYSSRSERVSDGHLNYSISHAKALAEVNKNRVYDFSKTKKLYNIFKNNIKEDFNIDLENSPYYSKIKDLTVSLNTKDEQVSITVANDVINSLFDSKIKNENITLFDKINQLGLNSQQYKENITQKFIAALNESSRKTKLAKINEIYSRDISQLLAKIQNERIIKENVATVYKNFKKITEQFDKHLFPTTSDIHIAELGYFKSLLPGNIQFSRRTNAISPGTITKIVNNFESYTRETAEKFNWLNYDEQLREDVDFLKAQFTEDNKFPSRALTLEENIAVNSIISRVYAQMVYLTKKETIARHNKMSKADLEVQLYVDTNLNSSKKLNIVSREFIYASSPDTYIYNNFGANSEISNILFNNVFSAYNTKLLKENKFIDLYSNAKEKYNIKDSWLAKIAVKDYNLSNSNVLDLYALSLTDRGRELLLNAGYKFIDNKNVRHLIEFENESEINAITDKLSADQKSFVEYVVNDLYNNTLKRYKAEKDIKYRGYEDIVNELYYPTNRAETRSINVSESQQNYKTLNLLNLDFNKQRTNNRTNPLLGMGFDERYNAYVDGLTKYGEMTEQLKDFDMFLNQFTKVSNRNTKARRIEVLTDNLAQTKGMNFNSFIGYLKDMILGNPVGQSNITNSKLFSNLVSATLAGNVSVVLKQTASLPTVLFEVKTTNWLKALAYIPKNIARYSQTKAELKNLSGILAQRFSDFDVVKGQTLTNNLSKIAKFFGIPMQKMDEAVIVGFAYQSAQFEAESLGYGKVGTASNQAEAINILNRIVANTQSNAIPLKMSMNRSGATGFMRKALSYFSSDLQNKISRIYNLAIERRQANKQLQFINEEIAKTNKLLETETNESSIATLNAKLKALTEIKKDKEVLVDKKAYLNSIGRTATAIFLSALMISGIDELIARLLGRKDWKEDSTEDFAINLLLEATINNFPYIGQIINSIEYDQDIGGFDFTIINQLIDIVNLIRDNGNWERGLIELSTMIGQLTGIPFKNLYNLFMGLYKNVSPDGYSAEALIKGYSSNYLLKEYKTALETGNTNKASGYLELVLTTHKGQEVNIEVEQELNKLYLAGYSALPKNTLNSYENEQGEVVAFNLEEQSIFNEVYKQATNEVNNLINLQEYNNYSDEDKAKLIKKVYDTYYEAAKVKATNTTTTNRLANLLLNNNFVNIANLVLNLNNLNSITETKTQTRKELIIKELNKLSISKKEKVMLLYLLGYSVSESNKKLININ